MQLQKIVNRRAKRLGRGEGSGKGSHTAGRGVKGQKSRRTVHVLFEGYKTKKSLVRRLPMQRGRGKFKPQGIKPLVVNLEVLEVFPDGTKIDLLSLVKAGIIRETDAKKYGVKILGDGKLTRKLSINLPISKTAAKKVLELGGKII